MVSMTICWLMAALLFLLLEMGHPGLFFFLSFSCGALIAALTSLYTDQVVLQGSLFLGVCVLTFIVLYSWTKKYRNGKRPYLSNVDALIGQRALVTQEITLANTGQAKLNGQIWSAKPSTQDHIGVGTQVEVIKVVGCHLVVRKINETNETKAI